MNWFENFLLGDSYNKKAYKFEKKINKAIKLDLKEIARTREKAFTHSAITIIEKFNDDNLDEFRVYFFKGHNGYVVTPTPYRHGYYVRPLFGGYTSGRYWLYTYNNHSIYGNQIKDTIKMLNSIADYAERKFTKTLEGNIRLVL